MLAREDFENKKVRRMETGHGNVMQVFIALRDVIPNQDAKLLHRQPQLLSRLRLGVLSLVLLGGKSTCVHDPNAF